MANDLAEAKRLLAMATRPALKELLANFIKATTARELEQLTSSSVDDGVSMETGMQVVYGQRDKPLTAGAESLTSSEPKIAPPEAEDLLEPAPLKQRDDNAAVDSAITAPPPTKLARTVPPPPVPGSGWMTPSYGWEQGEYNTPWVNVMVHVDGAGTVKDKVTCDFGQDSFDLRVVGACGKNYRLLVEALDKDIVPDESKIIVKKNRVTVKLKKVKGEYSYDHWTDLKKKGGKAAKDKEKNRDPTAGIMDLMKDLYDNGDDNMRKIIGESMLKSRNGEKVDPGDISKGFDAKSPDLDSKMPDLDLPDEPEELQ